MNIKSLMEVYDNNPIDDRLNPTNTDYLKIAENLISLLAESKLNKEHIKIISDIKILAKIAKLHMPSISIQLYQHLLKYYTSKNDDTEKANLNYKLAKVNQITYKEASLLSDYDKEKALDEAIKFYEIYYATFQPTTTIKSPKSSIKLYTTEELNVIKIKSEKRQILTITNLANNYISKGKLDARRGYLAKLDDLRIKLEELTSGSTNYTLEKFLQELSPLVSVLSYSDTEEQILQKLLSEFDLQKLTDDQYSKIVHLVSFVFLQDTKIQENVFLNEYNVITAAITKARRLLAKFQKNTNKDFLDIKQKIEENIIKALDIFEKGTGGKISKPRGLAALTVANLRARANIRGIKIPSKIKKKSDIIDFLRNPKKVGNKNKV